MRRTTTQLVIAESENLHLVWILLRYHSIKLLRVQSRQSLLDEDDRDASISKEQLIQANIDRTFGLPRKITQEFHEKWDRVVTLYLEGNWADAGKLFQQCLVLMPGDGPATNLHKFTSRHEYKAPSNWPGFRELTEK